MATKVLLVDDSKASRYGLRNWISKEEGTEIFEAANGLEGLQRFKEHQPDVTFLDLTMPVMDGFEALEEIRKIDPLAVVVVLTADVQQKTTQRVQELGAFMVLKKPPVKDSTIDALHKGLTARGKGR
ncbi:response regulator receiver protein [Candidatus Magnetobacterium bavaricum]|uniref:Response regulator receiver protein n=1 Tax=Candidatus Magnetobacterium bavaricum TaxID=29290 RepID=A0A0F3GXN2_9BACT|nr:response regulator receiver protein [Candidatus Magnetobacterium bavaricum]